MESSLRVPSAAATTLTRLLCLLVLFLMLASAVFGAAIALGYFRRIAV